MTVGRSHTSPPPALDVSPVHDIVDPFIGFVAQKMNPIARAARKIMSSTLNRESPSGVLLSRPEQSRPSLGLRTGIEMLRGQNGQIDMAYLGIGFTSGLPYGAREGTRGSSTEGGRTGCASGADRCSVQTGGVSQLPRLARREPEFHFEDRLRRFPGDRGGRRTPTKHARRTGRRKFLRNAGGSLLYCKSTPRRSQSLINTLLTRSHCTLLTRTLPRK